MDTVQLTFEAFSRRFHSEQACSDALFHARWPDGFRCPACDHPFFYLIRSRRLPLFECRSCRLQTSVTAGTIIDGSRTLLSRWFQAFFLLAQPQGISSLRLAEVLQVTYKTAWLMTQKIRHALQQADRDDPLTGLVKVHPFFYGYSHYEDARQPLLIGGSLADDHEPKFGFTSNGDKRLFGILGEIPEPLHVKIKQPDPRHVHPLSRRIQRPGVEAFVKEHTDGKSVAAIEQICKRRPLALHQIERNVSAWLNGTFQGIGAKHLQAYLDEFCFRLNMRFRNVPIWDRILQLCAGTPTLTYKIITLNKPVLAVPWSFWSSKAKWKGHHMKSLWDVG